jgi:hypothetical protein
LKQYERNEFGYYKLREFESKSELFEHIGHMDYGNIYRKEDGGKEGICFGF